MTGFQPRVEMSAAEVYHDFGTRQAAGESACFEEWALSLADDPEVLELVSALPPAKRQPNLVFAAARWQGAEPGPYAGFRSVLLSRWPEVWATVMARSTQTNEVGRCAALLPLLAALPQPLALLEVGASAGLCLYPDRYSYRYGDGTSLDPADGPSPVVLGCEVSGPVPMPSRLPEVAWRGGVDVNPLDVSDDDAMRWLQTLVWPEHEERRARLSRAVALVREDPPRLVRGDLNDEVGPLTALPPPDATVVVFHSAVLAYLGRDARARFVHTVTTLPGHWISNEGPRVLPRITKTLPPAAPMGADPFVLGLDGRGLGWAHGHGRYVAWPT